MNDIGNYIDVDLELVYSLCKVKGVISKKNENKTTDSMHGFIDFNRCKHSIFY